VSDGVTPAQGTFAHVAQLSMETPMFLASLVAAAALSLSAAAPADAAFPSDATFLSTVTPEVLSIEKDGDLTYVNVRFVLGGCLDQLGPVQYALHFDDAQGKYVLNAGGINIHTRGSMVSLCIALPQAFRTLVIRGDAPASLDDLVLEPLDVIDPVL
jgi:hypothetical protein